VTAIVELTGLSWPTVRSAIDRYEAGGAVALKPKERGKKHGEGRSLTAAQEDKIRKLICDKRPEQLKMDFALWTRAAVMLLIERECAIKLSVRAVGNYLKRWGFTPQKPIKRAYEQRPEAVKQWLDEEYPAINKRAKAEGGEIHWGDETALVLSAKLDAGFALASTTKQRRLESFRFNLNRKDSKNRSATKLRRGMSWRASGGAALGAERRRSGRRRGACARGSRNPPWRRRFRLARRPPRPVRARPRAAAAPPPWLGSCP